MSGYILKNEYRPDIDGLRAVAILFVLFFHAGFKLFPSGFIGVDVFFVISGFLITNIIHNSLQDNRFSFIDFYSRRLWRLQPVLICLIVSTILFTLIFYLPEDLIQYSKSARKASFFISNTFFERITKGYFSPNISQLPLLHSWSLSIEWQCYLILPAMIYCLCRINKKYTAKIIYLLTLFFLVLALFFSAKEPAKNYYHLSSRFFEFLIGSCIVFSQNRLSLNKFFLDLLSAVAILTLFYIATHENINVGFPNGYAVVLCCATAALIISGKYHPQSILIRLLSMRPIVGIGLLSYSLYIWHWPVLAFLRYLQIEETVPVLLCTFTLIFIISYFSWRFIEKPTRKFHKLKFGYSLTYLLIFPILLTHASDYAIKKYEGYPERFKEMANINMQLKRYAYLQRPLCLQEKNVEVNALCVLGANNSNSKIGFLFGDSHANHLWGFIDVLAQKANLSIQTHSTAACLSLPGIYQYDWNKEVYTACHEQTKRYYNMIRKNHYNFVILAQNWEGYLSGKLIKNESVELTKSRIEKALDSALRIIITSGARPVLVKTVQARYDAYDCFFNHIKQRKKYNSKECNFKGESNWQDDLFSRLKSKYTQLIIIDPKKVQCLKGQCSVDINGIPVFRDSGHITDYASYHLATRYLQLYQNPLT
ncbi:acyltransferase family protein [Legionella tucsonensis]|uniref:Acetyltransferase n=1 Tax=Legionella tucsonensis TaxID=40335 RepID=A0A0W0ZVT3_9GAMM|nr:acyltransferase family protein [Legionella tucsonensis]KTD73263.1 acetyltransferase [Legionella tucsonensis]